jgi:hypothetical protein
MARSADAKTPLATFAFTNGVFELQTQESGKKQWGLSALFAKGADISSLQKLAVDAAVEEWGDKARQMIKDKLIHSPFLDGDGPQGKSKKTGEPHKGFPGTTFLRLISGEAYRPKLVNKQVLPIASKDEFPSGSQGYAIVNAFTWENDAKGKGVSFGVSMIQVSKVAQGDEVLGGSGGGGNPDDHFEKIADAGDAPDSTKSGDGAAGLFS